MKTKPRRKQRGRASLSTKYNKYNKAYQELEKKRYRKPDASQSVAKTKPEQIPKPN